MANLMDISSIKQGVTVTPGTGTIETTRALHIGVGGDVNVTWSDGGTTLMKNVPDGATMPWCVKKVLATDTTATDIVALY